MKNTAKISLDHFKYFILQAAHRNAVGILSESEETVSFCNLTLLPCLNELTGTIEFKLRVCPETAIRTCANPDFRNNVQIGLMRSMIDITKNPQEVERVLKLSKQVKEAKVNSTLDSQLK